ncbi:hypothetical protein [Streptomyces kanamyceticus]|uniref:Uncharacterized protein n=1 Tax=Streptomyces kanamyceticus TaxID=1967 RepID=A0A5J6GF88_STRKN|nr:hypothetical protein [Streptomyces kanamyceticus]QEU92578.1 hypothetical protein CP970_18195 [Streptomyces kanamyceticus]
MTVTFSLDTDSDATVWPAMPILGEGRGAARDRKKWARRTSELLWALVDDEPVDKKQVKMLAYELDSVAEQLPRTVPVHQVFLYVPDPRREFLTFLVHAGPSEGDVDATLDELVQKNEPGAAQDPEVIDFDTTHLGRGKRSIRYFVAAKAEAMCVSVNYAWRIESLGIDVIVRTLGEDIGWITANIDEFDEFARSLFVNVDA